MKTLYALDEDLKLTHIDDVDKTEKKVFICCYCGKELIPRKGEINAHHFSHKNKLNCSYESYLHNLGKTRFYNDYSNCLKLGKPFFLQYKTRKTCTSCEGLNEIVDLTCELDNKLQLFDLTKRFDKIYLEKAHNGFVADILLKSSELGEVLFIEIAVTHNCEVEKINSGIRIIEINLSSENDLDFLSNNTLELNNKILTFYNFKVQHHKQKFYQSIDCKMPFEVFSVLANGKAIKKDMKMYRIIENIKKRDFLYFEVLDSFKEDDYFINADNYTYLITKASKLGIKVKNCYACRFSTRNNSYYRHYALFCKKFKCEIENSNVGSDCDKFWRIK